VPLSEEKCAQWLERAYQEATGRPASDIAVGLRNIATGYPAFGIRYGDARDAAQTICALATNAGFGHRHTIA
jgi:hypothetical protein